MENNLNVFNYQSNEVTFELGNGEIVVNATEMGKPFRKRPNDFLNLPSTISFIEALTNTRKSGNADYKAVTTRRGGYNPGTWLHEDLAIEFARWLDPRFAIWCNDRIKELLKHGFTAKEDVIDAMISDPDMGVRLLLNLKDERRKKELAIRAEEKALEEVNRLKPKAELADRIANDTNLLKMDTVAKVLQLPYGSTILFRKLREVGMIMQKSTKPYQKYINMGIFKLIETPYTDPKTGEQKFSFTTAATQKRGSIHCKEIGNHPISNFILI